MRFRRVAAIGLTGLAITGAFGACSAGGNSSNTVGVSAGDDSAPRLPNVDPGQPGVTPPNGFLLGADGQNVDANGVPTNIGTETLCDGKDENGNGIIDDVDKGRDGLCDCLHIGFFGALASDAGNKTGAFEAWLNARSDIPVKTISATTTITADVLAGLEVLVVGNLKDRPHDNSGKTGFSQAELDAISKWVNEDGGGIMTLAGYTANADDAEPTAALLAPFGLGYDYKGRGAGVDNMGSPPMIFRDIITPDHPTVAGITAMGVYNAYPVTGSGTAIFSDGTNVLGRAEEVGKGHVFAFADEWITQDALWLPMANRPLTQCQQACNQCNNNTCANCNTQCTNCQNQPCDGGQQVADGGVCRRGCDQSCTQCTSNCTTCEQACTTCTAAEAGDTLDIPRFWLNVMRWLTPSNECQVPLPTQIVF